MHFCSFALLPSFTFHFCFYYCVDLELYLCFLQRVTQESEQKLPLDLLFLLFFKAGKHNKITFNCLQNSFCSLAHSIRGAGGGKSLSKKVFLKAAVARGETHWVYFISLIISGCSLRSESTGILKGKELLIQVGWSILPHLFHNNTYHPVDWGGGVIGEE